MSDFGSSVSIYRVDRTPTDSADDLLVKSLSKELVYGNGDRISNYADFELRFGGISDVDGTDGINVGLTRYFIEDEEGNEDVLIARDASLAERFAEELQKQLGTTFKVESYAGHW